MNLRGRPFNIYFALAAACSLGLIACQSGTDDKKKFSTLRVHIETHDDPSGRSKVVPVYRKNPVKIPIDPSPIVDERHLAAASLEENWAGYHIKLEFNRRGTLLLGNMTATHVGKRLVIFSQFDETDRWLAAPVIRTRNSEGVLTFSPDANKQETQRIVDGLQNVVEEIEKKTRF